MDFLGNIFSEHEVRVRNVRSDDFQPNFSLNQFIASPTNSHQISRWRFRALHHVIRDSLDNRFQQNVFPNSENSLSVPQLVQERHFYQ